jgi:NAD+ synthase
MPCYSNPQDAQYAEIVANQFGISFKKVTLDSVYDNMLESLDAKNSLTLAAANIKPRLRMTALYFFAAINSYLVAGTSNKSELYVGYFTKHGDGGVDFEPIGHLVKSEVRDIARYLEVPAAIIERPPTAGLWEGQTDEDEMGITYEELDHYILTGAGPEQVMTHADQLMKKSEHKRCLPPIPPRA